MRAYADLHVHLYGCPTAADIWEWATTHPLDEARMEWYAREYQLATGHTPDWRSYFSDSSGLERLKQDYVQTTPGTFSAFQARINLPIAVCPLRPGDAGFLNPIMARHRQDPHLCHVEYRIILPHYFAAQDLEQYLETMTSACLALSDSSFTGRIALSVARSNDLCTPLLGQLFDWIKREPTLAAAITAIDFCGAEEGHPPEEKREIFSKIKGESPFQIAYHVGETLAGISPASMLRWIDRASMWGADRLGHATVLGLDAGGWNPEANVSEPEKETRLTQLWLKEIGGTGDDIESLQDLVMTRIAERKTLIECCPTSNRLLANLSSLAEHPIVRFCHHNLAVIVGSDDPGIFASPLHREFEELADVTALSRTQLEEIRLRGLAVATT